MGAVQLANLTKGRIYGVVLDICIRVTSRTAFCSPELSKYRNALTADNVGAVRTEYCSLRQELANWTAFPPLLYTGYVSD